MVVWNSSVLQEKSDQYQTEKYKIPDELSVTDILKQQNKGNGQLIT
jgi:hypothetical protein